MKFLNNLLFFFLALGILFASDYFFSIKRVEVISSEKKIKGIDKFQNKNLIFLNDRQVANYLSIANPNIRAVNIEKRYPNTLRMTISHHKSLAAISVDQGYFVLSEDGTIIKKSKEKPPLPIINYYQKLNYLFFKTGDKVDYKDILATLHFLKRTRDLGLKVITIDINGFNMIALNLNKKQIVFTTEKSIEEQTYKLETIVRQFKIGGRDFKFLDLRFDRPVLKY